jgi:hypothetical protein
MTRARVDEKIFLSAVRTHVPQGINDDRRQALCAADADQICYYSAGVGTLFGQRLIGGMFGYGLDDEVIRAYQWLVQNYDPDDRIYIFGFSRGAFTARSLSGFISKCGLLKPGAPVSLNQLYARYRKGSTVHTIRELKNVPDASLSLEDRWLKEYSLPIPIWFQGVWDTVGALGVPFGNFPTISRSKYAFLETDLRINNDRAFHAMAIDEHRETFAPTLWTKTVVKGDDSYPPRPLDEVEQRWFVGAHADVGGGYANDLLAQIPLQWLMQKAQLHGLVCKDTVIINGDESQAPVHDSFGQMLGGFYKLCKLGRPYFRSIGAAATQSGDATTTTINETIDATVFDRWRNNPAYRPENLVAWAQNRRVDPTSLHNPVRADDATPVS